MLKQILEEAIHSDEKVIVFSQFLPFGINKFKSELINDNFNCLELTGGMSSQERDYNIELFILIYFYIYDLKIYLLMYFHI